LEFINSPAILPPLEKFNVPLIISPFSKAKVTPAGKFMVSPFKSKVQLIGIISLAFTEEKSI